VARHENTYDNRHCVGCTRSSLWSFFQGNRCFAAPVAKEQIRETAWSITGAVGEVIFNYPAFRAAEF